MPDSALMNTCALGWIAEGALIVWEESAGVTPPDGLRVIDERRYGDTVIRFLRTAAPG